MDNREEIKVFSRDDDGVGPNRVVIYRIGHGDLHASCVWADDLTEADYCLLFRSYLPPDMSLREVADLLTWEEWRCMARPRPAIHVTAGRLVWRIFHEKNPVIANRASRMAFLAAAYPFRYFEGGCDPTEEALGRWQEEIKKLWNTKFREKEA